MSTISEMMGADHKKCDELQAGVEELISAGSWTQAEESFSEFVDLIEKHFRMEEQVLFPAFEEKTGMVQGPTMIMRAEHESIRETINTLQKALKDKDLDQFSGSAETLHIFIQQHNMKEEQILYPMSDQHLQAERDEIISQMKAV